MAAAEARAFIAAVPWRQVLQRPHSYSAEQGGVVDDPAGRPPDPHQYVILEWREIDDTDFERFRRLIRDTGYRASYRAPYRPDYEMRNWYLEIDGWCYWWMYPNRLNRERAEHRRHVPIGDEAGD